MASTRSTVPPSRLRALVRTLGGLARRIERSVRPGRRAWRGAAGGVAAGTAVVALLVIFHSALRPTATWGKVLSTGMRLGMALGAGLGGLLLLWLVTRLPRRFQIVLIVALGLLAPLIGGIGGSPAALVFYLSVWALAGAGLAIVADGGLSELSLVRRGIAVVGLMLGLAGIASTFVFLADGGSPAIEVIDAAREGVTPAPLELPDPSAPGPFRVLELTYGSGEDHRHEFGRDVDLVTEPVDGSDLLENWDGWSGWARTRFWGFDDDELPLQGRVWYPEGDGPFPLVLIVHGNHGMEEYSDPGYAWLGELLASRGYIFVSVDQNFINGSGGDGLDGGLREENDARGWLLLEHLAAWRDWHGGGDGPFAGKVDLERIGLIGHSRGGEAVAVAAAFNELPFYPDDATVEFDYGFDIGAVIAIAPVYGQYRPAGLLTPLQDVNYLVLHGANDGDVTSFAGSAQYEAVELSGASYRFKSTVYVYGANHGQFNTVWGNTDWGAPFSAMLNTEALMPGEDQRQAGKVFIGAFLEAALRDRHGYLPLFTDARRGDAWLPDTIYLTDFRDSRFRTVADFDEDLDVTTATLAGARIESEGLTRWREDRVGLKSRDKSTNAAFVGWQVQEEEEDAAHHRGDAPEDSDGGEDHDGTAHDPPSEPSPLPRYTIRFADGYDASTATALVMSLADADESPEPKSDEDNEDASGNGADDEHRADGVGEQDGNEHGAQSGSEHDEGTSDEDAGDAMEEADDEPEPPIDLTVRLTDAGGRSAELPLSRFAPVQRQLEVETTKGIFSDAERSSEVVYQTFALDLEWFLEITPELDLARLATIELRFDRSEEGMLVIDDVGFAQRDVASGADAVGP